MKKTKTRDLILTILLIAAFCGLLGYYQADTSKHSYAISIIERSAIYAVVAVAMNLLNGFTGLFSLGQAGFMAIGAYVTAVLTIPVEVRPSVYSGAAAEERLSGHCHSGLRGDHPCPAGGSHDGPDHQRFLRPE